MNGSVIKLIGLMILFCGILCWVVLLPDYRELKQLPIASVIQPVAPQLKQHAHHDIISEVVSTAEQSGILVKIEQSQQVGSIGITAQADFLSLLSFVKTLSDLSVLLSEVTFHVEKDSIVTMKALLIDYPYLLHSHFDLLKSAKNPMQLIDSHFVLSDRNDNPQTFNTVSIKQLKYVGYLSKNGQLSGLLQSLNGVAGLIVVRMTIGLEKAKVITVNEHNVVLQIPSHGVFVLLKSI
jgi:hypothetical protein